MAERRSLLMPAVAAGLLLVLLLALGTWQVQRLFWKRALIATIEERIAAPPVALPPADEIDPQAWEYRRVTVRGRFRHDREMYLLAHTRRGNLGYQVVTPLVRADGGHVLVNRGWVPADRRDPATRPDSQPDGVTTVEGIVRTGWRQGWLVPDNDPAANQWFFADLAAMARHAGVAAPPLFVEAVAEPAPTALPIGGQTRLDIPNNHLQYAVTWYALAVVLIVMCIIYWRQFRAAWNRNDGARP